ncbi:ABC transporter substrate-binding protein [Methanobrevibacter sp.]|uniref:ABC transporter substrate-binding protein n=1 Tax=Methanobrevibacter sp. TaxID=66852 RepID=UPI0038910DD1
MNKKISAVILIVIAIIIAGAYFTSHTDDNTLDIGYLPSDHDSALFVANAQGEFSKAGINVRLVQFNNGGDLMTAMASGDVDAGYVGITPVLSAMEKGVPIKVISAAQTEGSAIVVSPESGINSVSDLAGKKIATPGEASIQHMLLTYYLKENGMSINDLKVSGMKVPSMNDALKTKKIDGMITFEPYVSTALADGNNLLIDSSEILPNHPCCVVVASEKYLDNHPNETKKLLEIHNNETKFINDKIAEGKTSEVVDQLPVDIISNKEVEKDSLESFPFISGLNETFKQDVIDFMNLEVELGVLKKPISENEIFWQDN